MNEDLEVMKIIMDCYKNEKCKYKVHIFGSFHSMEVYNKQGGEYFESEEEAREAVKDYWEIEDDEFELYKSN